MWVTAVLQLTAVLPTVGRLSFSSKEFVLLAQRAMLVTVIIQPTQLLHYLPITYNCEYKSTRVYLYYPKFQLQKAQTFIIYFTWCGLAQKCNVTILL